MEKIGIKITEKGIEAIGSITMDKAYQLLYHGIAALTENMVTNYCKDKSLDPTSLEDTKEIRKILHDDIVLNISYLCNKLYPDAVESTSDSVTTEPDPLNDNNKQETA